MTLILLENGFELMRFNHNINICKGQSLALVKDSGRILVKVKGIGHTISEDSFITTVEVKILENHGFLHKEVDSE